MIYVVEHNAWYTKDAEQMKYRSIHVCSLHMHLCIYYVYIKYVYIKYVLLNMQECLMPYAHRCTHIPAADNTTEQIRLGFTKEKGKRTNIH